MVGGRTSPSSRGCFQYLSIVGEMDLDVHPYLVSTKLPSLSARPKVNFPAVRHHRMNKKMWVNAIVNFQFQGHFKVKM